jgi:GMP synthase (glutamine-hydrolysing)
VRRVLVILHLESEPLGAIEEPLRAAGLDLDVRLAAKSLPASLAEHQGLVVMGGPMGVYEADQFNHLRAELRLLRGALANDIPTLGICLGSQLLAAAADAKVFKGPAPEIGWAPVTLTAEDPWLAGWPTAFEPLHWHGDTFDLPKGAVHLASSATYSNQAFRLGSALGLQFHVEATEEMANAWMTDPDASAEWRPPTDQISRNKSAVAAMAPLAQSLGETFARAVRGA